MLVTLVSIQSPPAMAQSSSIVIAQDCSVNPSTAPIEKAGSTYRLTADMDKIQVIIEKNGIVFDGQGFAIQGSDTWNNKAAITLRCTGTTVINCRVMGWQVGILGVYDGNKIVNNTLTGNSYSASIYASNYQVTGNEVGYERVVGNNNVFSGNRIVLGGYMTGFWISNSSGTTIEANNVTFAQQTTSFISTDNSNPKVYHNNFLNIEVNTGGALSFVIGGDLPFWDGNYWSDYRGRYPNASEIGTSGIWDTPYVSMVTQRIIDRSPLVTPYNIAEPVMPQEATPTPTPQPTESRAENLTPAPSVSEFPAYIILFAVAVIVLAAVFMNKKLLKHPRVSATHNLSD